ncbi:hypothetical protein CAFE_18080 [Caprobacter fermentans]|uniref:DUF2190 family protein n=1 Tax=Caproicibacter fermentans TaxID=2576756 RepID=A0A6N8HZ68_9FIRM|nr:hypothetical protein [Caproicibacter fermentans]MVB11106.1 hypothetical protein [Caproicibacter fermentans]OCN01751.1 hypothetical protein A7X67_01290 [Clostridium sp. W14A]
MNVSLNGFRESMVTFEAEQGVAAGAPVKLTANGTVGPCADGEVFCGVAENERCGFAAVRLGGYVRLPYDGTAPAVGYQTLCAAANGKIKTAETGGRSLLVTDVDEAANLCGVIL